MGFFSLRADMVPAHKTKVSGCRVCRLDKSGSLSRFVGEGKDKVLILADHPRGREGNEKDTILLHKMYDVLWDYQGKRGLPYDFLEAAWFGYVIPCPTNSDKEISPLCCKERLDKLINEFKPNVIIPMGPTAVQALVWDRMSGRIKNTQPSDLYGKCIPDRYYNCWICPTFSPEFISWQRDDHCPAMYLGQHLRMAWALKDKPLPVIPKDIRTTGDAELAAAWVEEILDWSDAGLLDKAPDGANDVSIDYETTGLKPHRTGHSITAASVGYRKDGEYHAIGFRWNTDNERLTKAWYRLTHNESLGLVAHKADYEACWTRFRSGLHGSRTDWPTNWSWDTCLCAHVIDNTQKVGLKLHTYCELGVLGYDNKVDGILSTPYDGENKASCNAFNMLKKGYGIPWSDLIYYCAQDSLYTLFIRDRQVSQLAGMEGSFRFFMEGMDALAKVQSEGLPIDYAKINELKADLENKLKSAEDDVKASEEALKWQEKNKGEEFNPGSNKQIVDVLYNICNLKPPSGTKDATGDTLEKLGTPFCKSILAMRRWSKILDFLDGYTREAVWDDVKNTYLIRPFFNLSTGAGGDGNGGPSSYRSSADSPNFQNIPKRDKEMKKLLRSLFVAPPGYRFMEMDYKSLEVMVSASYHHDPQMIHYLQDPSSDMHRDTACDMYLRKHDELTKDERSSIKSGYVFSSFYGASYKSCALNMWNNMPKYTREHLAKDCNIDTYDKWEAHVKKGDDIFWNKRFKVYNQWRSKEWQRYQDFGYVQSYTGFRCRGPMGYTEATNRCIQGSAFHILLRALTWDLRDIKAQGLQSVIIGQIHDAIIALVKEGEEDKLARIIYHNGVERVSKEFPWICVPLVIEAEMSEVGGSWAKMTDVGALGSDGIADRDWISRFKSE